MVGVKRCKKAYLGPDRISYVKVVGHADVDEKGREILVVRIVSKCESNINYKLHT